MAGEGLMLSDDENNGKDAEKFKSNFFNWIKKKKRKKKKCFNIFTTVD